MVEANEPPTPARAPPTPGGAAGRPARRRARGVAGAIGVTSLAAILPGAGYLYSGRKVLGLSVLIPSLVLIVLALASLPHDLNGALDLAFDPKQLRIAAMTLGAVLLAWVVIVVTTFLMVRPVGVRPWQTLAGATFVGVLCIAVAAPLALTARYAVVQADLVETVFHNNRHAPTAPKDVDHDDPWGGRKRVNVLLLGGDGGPHREGVRTDSMILISVDTESGRAVTFSFPRNMMDAQFPRHSPLHHAYPYGFRGPGDAGNWMLNAVYRQVPLLHPHILGRSDNEGADAIKQAIQGSTGLRVDYYVLINFKGFEELVDAIGGVTVNINEPVAIGGITDLGVPPDGYLQPGPNQHLNGFKALWFSRGRYGADDYQRMERQRCMINAIVDKADPLNLIRRYQAVARASKDLVSTDIPRDLLPAFVDLALKVKDRRMKSVVFRYNDKFNPGDPDFAYLRRTVANALANHPRTHKAHTPRGEQDSTNACAYKPLP